MRKRSPGDWWSLGGAEAIEVGRVSVGVLQGNLGRVTAAFTVPELPPGTYDVMLCDSACAEPLPDVIPTEGFTVVADPATAAVANRVDRLERRSRRPARQVAAARADAVAARSEVERLEAKLSSLANEDRGSGWANAGWLVAGALAAAVVVLLLHRRRSRELVSSE
jgi:hypothetical protein